VATDAAGTLSAKLRGLVKLTAEVLGPVLGATIGAAVITDVNGTIQQYLRGLVKLTAEILGPVLGATTGAAVTTDANGTIQQYLRGLVTLWLANQPVVGNAPANPGQALAVADNASHEVTVADLVPLVRYALYVRPTANPDDFVTGVFKCAAGGGAIASLTDGWSVDSRVPVQVCLPASSTKVRVYYMRDALTPFNCTVYLARMDA